MIDEIVKFTQNRIKRLQSALYVALLELFIDSIALDGNGRIAYNSNNISTVNNIDKKVRPKIDKELVGLKKYVLKSVASVVNREAQEYRTIDVRAIESGEKAMKKVIKHAEKKVEQVTDLTEVFGTFKQRALALMSQPDGISLREMREQLQNDFTGDKGLVQSRFNRWTYDLYSQYERVTGNEIRKDLGFKYAIYEGGEIETTRNFCEQRNRKVFSEQEINSWRDLSWQGKNTIGYNPIFDCGGYNCRHKLRWIGTELALKLRGEA